MPPEIPRKSGLYALLRCDGGPLAADDLAILGIGVKEPQHAWSAAGHDGQSAAAVFEYRADGSHTIVVGELEELADLASILGLSKAAPAAAVAAAALARFSADTPLHLIGEWSMLHRAADGTVTAMLSAARRDPVLLAQRGTKFAIAPDLFRLVQLDWVEAAIDEAGLLARVGRAPIRERRGGRTIVRGIRELHPGESLTIAPDGAISSSSCNPFTPQVRNNGSYADLVAQTEELLSKIMNERAARTPRSAVLLSGGLDSSLLAAFAAQAEGSEHVCISSVAPTGSGLPDEAHFARLAAAELHLPFHPAAPEEALNAYRPTDYILAGANGPPLSNRHTLTEQFQRVARASDVQLLINGSYGESNATVRLPPQSAYLRFRGMAAAVWHRLAPPGNPALEQYPFQVRLAEHRMAELPQAIRALIETSPVDPVWPPRDGLFGYFPAAEKALGRNNEFYPGALRMDFPFRDLRLSRLFAGFPLKTLLSAGHDRPVVRSLLDGRLPDAIRLRRRGMPASPDHLPRLQRHAEAARLRIADFRQAELDEWLDLDWLDQALGQVAARGSWSPVRSGQGRPVR